MEWIDIEKELPKKEGFYLCYRPESKIYRESYDDTWFDGKDFRDGDSLRIWTDTRMYGHKVNKFISHWMKIIKPTNL